ncbi:DUF1834 family protein [Caballeronia sp. LZ001]|uniref:DUF1834 family protein n=1 Tax=Caballeronia sp. LZ001 TaxID=3038553 RepID=UPI002855F87C|nr:DUF1834 family protein [Caballeronia sp. LZ001]MDR5803405.1 DUF1834 family protein [Caballeronia sp. LZ001]
MAYVPIITAIELAIVDRLRRGLGRMVDEVSTYGGEFDDDEFDTVIRRFPAAWVTFGGVRRTEPHSAGRTKWRAEATFVVMVGARSLRSEQTSRHGGAAKAEVGTNLIVSAVRYLLNQQDMALPIRELQPGSIRTLFNTRTRDEAISVFALEFHTAWVEDSLFLGAFPHGVSEGSLARAFEEYGGQIDPPPADWKATVLRYYLRPQNENAPDAEDRLEPKEKS